ncbi:VanZ family protein [Candidatus Roizmanbacteria bacterium]|nr:VanZ family protein [Candidatus Roizmanbacteria bacterium]
MGKFSRFIRYWLPPIVWMAFIFYLSSRLSVTVTGKFLFDFLIFKALHMIEYAILYFLLFRAFYSVNNNLLFPVIFSILYAVLDEFHQTFVPTREGKIRDVIVDTVGIILMYIYINSHMNFVKKFL